MKVFVSHSRQNASAALKLCERLQTLDVDPWLDLRELDPGADWREQIAAAIRSVQGFIFLIGPAEQPDQGQRYEWQQVTEEEYYLDASRPLIPVLIGSAEIPGFLRTRQTIEVDAAAIDFDGLARTIADALKQPEQTVDHEKLERGRAARQQALDTLREYSIDLEKADVKRAGLRGLK
jgi:hypothetical protein